jgi:hypothetical protein
LGVNVWKDTGNKQASSDASSMKYDGNSACPAHGRHQYDMQIYGNHCCSVATGQLPVALTVLSTMWTLHDWVNSWYQRILFSFIPFVRPHGRLSLHRLLKTTPISLLPSRRVMAVVRTGSKYVLLQLQQTFLSVVEKSDGRWTSTLISPTCYQLQKGVFIFGTDIVRYTKSVMHHLGCAKVPQMATNCCLSPAYVVMAHRFVDWSEASNHWGSTCDWAAATDWRQACHRGTVGNGGSARNWNGRT